MDVAWATPSSPTAAAGAAASVPYRGAKSTRALTSAVGVPLAAYMRPRVANVVPSPPPGIYEGPVTIKLTCATPNAEIIYTRSATMPFLNSDKEHAYRSDRYVHSQGITIAGPGKHIVTVVGLKKGLIDARPQRLTYTLSGGPEAPKSRSEQLREAMMNRQFEGTASHETSMPFLMARRGGRLRPASRQSERPGSRASASRPGTSQSEPSSELATLMMPRAYSSHSVVQCDDGNDEPIFALAETANLRQLAELRQQGKRIELFAVRQANGCVSRSAAYRRVVPPSTSLTVPPDPLKAKPTSTPPSLRSAPDGGALVQRRTYDAPRAASALGSAAAGGASVPLPRPGSRAVTPYGTQRRPPSRTTTVAESLDGSRPPTAAGSVQRLRASGANRSTHTQLTWFESRRGLSAADPADDADDEQQEVAYQEGLASEMAAEVQRVSRVSERFEKAFTAPSPVATSDVASESKRFLTLVLTASEARRTDLRRLLSIRSYHEIAPQLEKRGTVSAVDLTALLAGVAPGEITHRDFDAALRELVPALATDPKPALPAALCLLLLRYVVWTASSVAEAVFCLLLQFKQDQAPAERNITRLEAMAVLDRYRRTRGSHPVAAAAFEDAVCNTIEWSESHDVELEAMATALAAIPIIDAAVAQATAMSSAMYRTPLPLYQ